MGGGGHQNPWIPVKINELTTEFTEEVSKTSAEVGKKLSPTEKTL